MDTPIPEFDAELATATYSVAVEVNDLVIHAIRRRNLKTASSRLRAIVWPHLAEYHALADLLTSPDAPIAEKRDALSLCKEQVIRRLNNACGTAVNIFRLPCPFNIASVSPFTRKQRQQALAALRQLLQLHPHGTPVAGELLGCGWPPRKPRDNPFER